MANWKKLSGHTKYSVSDEGQVRNDKTGSMLRQWLDSNGYYSVSLYESKKTKIARVHHLVAEAFIPNPENLHDVNHEDGNKSNNLVSNLIWCTRSYNMLHSTQTLGRKQRTHKRILVECVETGEVYPSVTAAARKISRSDMALRKCLYGQTKTCAGNHWRYFYDCENGSDPGREGYDLWLCKSRWEEYFGIPEEQSIAADGEQYRSVDAMR